MREPDLQGVASNGYAAERLAAIVDSSTDAIISKTVTGIVQTWNPGAERLYGYPAGEMIGRPMSLLLPPDRAGEEDEILARIARGERVQHFETVRLRKDRRLINVSVTISPVRNDKGEVIGASHIARDISERVEFGRLTGLLAAIVESAEDAVVGKDLSGVIQSWNQGAEKLYGYSPEEAIGRSMTMLLPPGRENGEADILARIGRGERVEHFETERLRGDGKRINVSITISPIRNGGGKIIGASH